MFTQEIIPAIVADIRPLVKAEVGSPYTFYGEPKAASMTLDSQLQMSLVEYKEEIYYINNTYKPITVTKRDGLSVTIPRTNSVHTRTFMIRKIIEFKAAALRSALECVTSIKDIDSGDLVELKRCLLQLQAKKFGEASIMLDYIVDYDNLIAKGGCIYHQQMDVVLSVKDCLHAEVHPFSTRFLNVDRFGKTEHYGEQNELNIKIRLVDHSVTAEPKYINVFGKTLKLKPQKDSPHRHLVSSVGGKKVESTYEDYLQIFYSADNDPEVIKNKGVGTFSVTLEEAKESLGVYDTYADAINSGDIEASRKEKLTKMLYEVELLKSETARQKALFEQQEMQHKEHMADQNRRLEIEKNEISRKKQELENFNLELQNRAAIQKEAQSKIDAELLQLENAKTMLNMQRKSQDEDLSRARAEYTDKLAQNRSEHETRMKNESNYWKDYYEMKQAARKETSDVVKFIPGLLVGVAGIAAAWIKFSAGAPAVK